MPSVTASEAEQQQQQEKLEEYFTDVQK